VIDPLASAIVDLGGLSNPPAAFFAVPNPKPFPVTTVTVQALSGDQLSVAPTVTVE